MPVPGSDHKVMNLAAVRGSLAISLIAAALTSAALAGTALAGPVEEATAANLRRDYAAALFLLRPLAEEGNPAAQNLLGGMYALGTGVRLDHTEAAAWYRRAADQGNAAAQYNLGVAYANGLGVQQDNAEALKWYRKAADQGDADAQRIVHEWKPSGQLPSAVSSTSASTRIARGANLDVGRVALQISDDGWESLGASRQGLPFSGDRSGDMPFDTQHLLLRGRAGDFRAVATVAASRGIARGRFDWITDCQSASNLYAVDGTGGRIGASDCLQVSGLIQMRRFLESRAPDLLADLIGHNVALPDAAYLVIFQKGVDSGAFTFVQVLFAADFTLPSRPGSAVNLPAGVKPDAVAWGLHLAEAVRSSVYSPSGTMVLPTVTAKEN